MLYVEDGKVKGKIRPEAELNLLKTVINKYRTSTPICEYNYDRWYTQKTEEIRSQERSITECPVCPGSKPERTNGVSDSIALRIRCSNHASCSAILMATGLEATIDNIGAGQ